MPEIIGVAFPIMKRDINRFFEDGKSVFIKPATIFKELKKGQKFFFYQSREDTGYAGEAIIQSITHRDDPLDFFNLFGDRIFLNEFEVAKYLEENKKWVTSRKNPSRQRKRPWIALELDKIKKYPQVVKISGFVPVSGTYIRK